MPLRTQLAPGAILRPPGEADAPALYARIDADREALAPWLAWAAEQTEGATLAYIRAVRDQAAAGNGQQSLIVVDGEPAGVVGMHGIVGRHDTTSLGYWLTSRFRGRGLMTSGVRAYVDHAFQDLALHRVEIQAAVHNHASRAVAERTGFREEGIRREAERVGGERYDMVVYGRLATDAG